MIAAAMGAATPWPAAACGFAADQTRILHDELSEVPHGAIAAEVEIIHAGSTDFTLTDAPVSDPLKARIIRVLHGAPPGDTILVDRRHISSCDIWPEKGDQGIIVGRVLSISDDAVTVRALRALSPMEVWELQEARQRARRKAAMTGFAGLLVCLVAFALWLRRRRTELSTDPL